MNLDVNSACSFVSFSFVLAEIDIALLQRLLEQSADTAESELARHIVSNLNFRYLISSAWYACRLPLMFGASRCCDCAGRRLTLPGHLEPQSAADSTARALLAHQMQDEELEEEEKDAVLAKRRNPLIGAPASGDLMVDGAPEFLEPKLGWQFHRSLLIMLVFSAHTFVPFKIRGL